jgi:hypothetical protein
MANLADIASSFSDDSSLFVGLPKLVGWRANIFKTPQVKNQLIRRESRSGAKLPLMLSAAEYLWSGADDIDVESIPPESQTFSHVQGAEILSDVLTLLRLSGTESPVALDQPGLIDVISAINGVLKARAFNLLDAIFDAVDASKTDPTVLIAFLRTSFAVRMKLSSWQPLLKRAAAEFQQRGLDGERLLRGL